jgi:mannose-6-phosphate isomerase-like protein (cupin superfamily)
MSVIAPGEGEVVGDTPERRLEILAEREGLHATWTRFGPGREGADLHVHRHHTDIFYVLAGELTMRVGSEDEPVAVGPGTFARVPPMVVHGFANRGAAELRYLNFHAPGLGFADYLRGLARGRQVGCDQEPPPADGLRPASDAAIGEPAIDIDAIGIAELMVEPSAPHVHPGLQLAFYVLAGTLSLALADRRVDAVAGSWVDVPPGTPHTITGAARCLSIRTPAS